MSHNSRSSAEGDDTFDFERDVDAALEAQYAAMQDFLNGKATEPSGNLGDLAGFVGKKSRKKAE